MKTKECLKRGARLVEIGIRKATSYKVVKNRLNYRLYSDEFLQAKISANKQELDELING